jgi:translation elongation factor EF-1beta
LLRFSVLRERICIELTLSFFASSLQLVPIGYGIKKLQITLVITDDCSLDTIQDEIAEFEDYVQSTDVIAMQKVSHASLVVYQSLLAVAECK